MPGEVFDIRLCNVIVLGLSFMLIFTAFQTASMAEESVLNSADKPDNSSLSNGTSTFEGAGYKSLSVIYIVFAVSNWVAPSIVVVIGAKLSMFFGSLLYLLFIVSFLKPMLWSLYTGSVLVGFGAAVLWTGQGNFLTTNSDSETISRNSGIFWALLQFSLLFGNAYSYFVLKGAQVISSDERTKLFIGLSGAGLLGSLCLLFLRKRRSSDPDNINLNSSGQVIADTPLSVLKRSFHLIRTKEMLLLAITIFYTGIELTFFSGVYGTCLSNNFFFGSDAKGLIGISGMFIGVGEIIGRLIVWTDGKVDQSSWSRLDHHVWLRGPHDCFLLDLYQPTRRSPIEETTIMDATYITSSKYVAILCSFLLGLGDSCFNTQLYSLLGFMFPEDSSPAFAIFKFVQSISAAAGFFYSDYLALQYQLLILVILGTFGSLTFSLVEWKSTRTTTEGYQSI